MILLIISIILILIISYIIKNKLIIRFDTFLRKGFEKTSDKYGVYCYVGKQR